MSKSHLAKGILLGVSVGDALGVPVEFLKRSEIAKNPVTGMRGFGTHDQPPGTWSDDSSLTFCLAEMLAKEYSINTLAEYFIQWFDNSFWTARGNVFDIGIATRVSIEKLKESFSPATSGNTSESSNGNGSLMRILPLILIYENKNVEERFQLARQVSSITHAHIRSVLACFVYLELAFELHKNKSSVKALQQAQLNVNSFLKTRTDIGDEEKDIINGYWHCHERQLSEIKSSGYVAHTLEAAIWCLFHGSSYEQIVLTAVNLGDDTDTVAAVAGGLAGILYGWQNIPNAWLEQLASRDKIIALAEKFN